MPTWAYCATHILAQLFIRVEREEADGKMHQISVLICRPRSEREANATITVDVTEPIKGGHGVVGMGTMGTHK